MSIHRLLRRAFPEGPMSRQQMRAGTRPHRFAILAQPGIWATVALALPFVFLLWPGFYAMDQPELWGIPFFYWFQLMWIPLTSLITLILYWKRIDL